MAAYLQSGQARALLGTIAKTKKQNEAGLSTVGTSAVGFDDQGSNPLDFADSTPCTRSRRLFVPISNMHTSAWATSPTTAVGRLEDGVLVCLALAAAAPLDDVGCTDR